MTLLEWTLFCGENPHLVKGIMFATPPGAMLQWSRAYIERLTEEQMIQTLAAFQVDDPKVATLDWVLLRYSVLPRKGPVPIGLEWEPSRACSQVVNNFSKKVVDHARESGVKPR